MSMRIPSAGGRRLAVVLVLVVLLGGCLGMADGPSNGGAVTSGVPTAGGAERAATTTAAQTTGMPMNGTLAVHFIDVGQSTSILVVGPEGTTVLIDSGDFRDRGEDVLAYLQRHDVERIDALVTSHADADHIGGHAQIIEYYETNGNGVGAVYDPGIAASTNTYERYLDAVDRYDVPLYRTLAGDSIPVEGATVNVLAPPHPYLDNEQRNENSIVLRIAYGNTSFLLTGDGEAAEERYLVTKYGSDLNATVLVAGHHGSRTSSDEAFLDAVDPAAAVISSAYDSQYGHPHVETLRRLADRSIPTYWTATHGDLVFRSNGSAIAVFGQRRAITDPLRLRQSPPVPDESSDSVVRLGTIRGDRVTGAPTGSTVSSTTATTTVATDGGTSRALSVVEIHADAAGDESANLNDEYVTFRNDGEATLHLGGWTVADEANHEYTVPAGFTLAPGATVTLHTGSGTDAAADLYWGQDAPVWNNGGDTIHVRSGDGTLVVEVTYP